MISPDLNSAFTSASDSQKVRNWPLLSIRKFLTSSSWSGVIASGFS